MCNIESHQWTGAMNTYFDTADVSLCGNVVIGKYGGNTESGASKNEDGLIVWCDKEKKWEFAVLMDAHHSSKSIEVLLNLFQDESSKIIESLQLPVEQSFHSVQMHIISIFSSPELIDCCKQIQGETACLICVRKDRYLWWFNVGDCSLYLFHPEFSKLGQYAVNQRSFFEWIGNRNTFDQTVPCYTVGTKQLRQGANTIVVATDGLLECGSQPFQDPGRLYESLYEDAGDLEQKVHRTLTRVHEESGKDSATVLAWTCYCDVPGTYPSNVKS